MPAYKDNKTGTWFDKFYCKDWTGENKQIKKRGFVTKREALDYERNYKIRQENNLDMTFGEFWKLYTEDVKPRVKLNTWLTKENIVEKKILPYFKNLKMNEITPADVRKWQNEMLALTDTEGKPYSQTYRKTMHNTLSTIFNHACRFYNLKSNPANPTNSAMCSALIAANSFFKANNFYSVIFNTYLDWLAFIIGTVIYSVR